MLSLSRRVRLLSVPALLLAASASAAQDAPCSGGPGGNFDWVIQQGEIFMLDTHGTAIPGGPGGVPTTIQNSVEGIVEVRDLIIEEGGTLRAFGPYPLRICATGKVEIRGTLDVSGFKANDVATLNTGNTVEVGAAGGPGGGKGGDANTNTTMSTIRGGEGHGPLEIQNGGMGGESGFAPASLGKEARRPGGGGGGRFAADPATLAASTGSDGNSQAKGAFTFIPPPWGGKPGSGPFLDADPSNDFFGVQPILGPSGEIAGFVRGELRSLWAGYGGGGGGNAIPASQFPNPNWSIASDEKGGGGGGGGGGLHIRALGKIVFGALGTVLAKGGRGATGENVLFLDHIGGSGGSGSGGHVVLESATQIDFTDGDPVSAAVRNWIDAVGGTKVIGPVSSSGPGCLAPCPWSNGGAGGPGVVQLHVPLALYEVAPDLSAGVVIPLAAVGAANPLGEVAAPDPFLLLPTRILGGQGSDARAWLGRQASNLRPGG